MKHSIATRLFFYFATALLLLSLVAGSAFTLLFARHTTALHQQELRKKAQSIAGTLGDFYRQPGAGRGDHGGQGGYGAYMNFLDEIAMTDVWVMDANSQLISRGHGHDDVSYSDLPPDAEQIVTQALAGQTVTSEGFSELLGSKSVTVGVPVISGASGQVSGVVLLHAPVEGISAAIVDGLQTLLISISVALVCAAGAAYLLSMKFTRPLQRMNQTALLLAQGDYQAKNALQQQDEIGQLAGAMDLLSERLFTASQESQKLEQMRREFVSNISHELRTPVTVLRGSLEALCDGVIDTPAQVDEYHRQMLAESVHLQRLVNDLLDLSRLQSPSFAIELAALSLRDVLEDVARSMQRIAATKQVALTTQIQPPTFDMTLQGDYGRIRQMLMIVLDNAVKFSQPEQAVELALCQTEQGAAVSVTDHGCGIAPADLPRLFERFHKAQTKENSAGTGLGLAIAQEIAARHGVELQVRSQPGETVFTLLF